MKTKVEKKGIILSIALLCTIFLNIFAIAFAQPMLLLNTDDELGYDSHVLILDTDNTGPGQDVDIVANQGSDEDGIIRYNSTENQWEFSNDGGVFAPIGTGGAGLVKMFQGIDSTGGLKLSNIAQPIPFDYVNIKDDFYSHSTTVNPGEVTILNSGWYQVHAMITVQTLSDTEGVRGNPVMHIEVDSGSGFVEQPDETGGYIRENAAGQLSASLSGTGFFYFDANDKIRITIYDTVAAEPDEATVANSSRLVLDYIDRTGNSSGAVDNLKDIGDVNAPAPNDGDVLTFDNATSKWVPQATQATHTQNTDTGSTINTFTLDEDDTGGNVDLIFGNTVAEYLRHDGTNFIFSDDVSLGGKELKDFKIDQLASAPTCDGSANGRMYYNTTENNTYVCNGTSWERINGADGATIDGLSSVQARRDTAFTLTAQDTWYDIPFTQTDVETNTDHLQHNDTNTERVDVKADGLYLITYELDAVDAAVAHQVQSRVYLNGTSAIVGTYLEQINNANYHGPITSTTLAELTAGDYITLQAVRLTDGGIIGQPLLTITKLDGVIGEKGDQGLPGSVGLGTNENSFTLDLDDTGGDVILRFGTTLDEMLKWDNTNTMFTFTDDVFIEGTLQIGDGDTGDITIDDSDGFYRESGNGTFKFGINAANPQFYLGDPTGTSNAFIDVDNGADLRLNTLESTPGAVVIGDGGLDLTGDVNANDIFASNLDLGGDLTGAFIDGDLNSISDLDWSSIDTRIKKLRVNMGDLAIIPDGTNNLANIYQEAEPGSNPHLYYLLQSTQGTLQDLDLVIKVKLPEDFVNFAATDDINFYYKNTGVNNTDSKIDVLVEDDDGDDAYLATEGQGLFNTSWTLYSNEFDGGSFNPVAGEYIYIIVKGYGSYDADYQSAYMGEIVLTYTGR